MTSITAACEMGNHDGCYKGRHPDHRDSVYLWCECPCHPWEEHISGWQRFVRWLRS
jgi:hypothetical protein